MGNYKIKVNVEIVECTESKLNNPVKKGDGSFEMAISEADAVSIDKCEQALLQTNYEAIRDEISRHLTEVSEKKALERREEGELTTNTHPYQVDGEVGRFTFRTHRIEKSGETLYNSKEELFPELKGKEWYKTSGFKEIGMIYGATEESYRKTARLINRIRHQEGATPVRTLQANTEEEGTKIIDFLGRKTGEILEGKNFTKEGRPKEESEEYKREGELMAEEKIEQAIEECKLTSEEVEEVKKNPVVYEVTEKTINISIDDVGVKKQKENRGDDEETGKRKYAHNTVAHIQKGDDSYVINGSSTLSVLRIIIGFLLNNDLLKDRLQFFVDGQRTLQAAILKAFFWFKNIGLILDWYHLEEKCKMQLSMAMKGKEIRNNVLDELMPLLWYGMVDKAIEYLSKLEGELIKNKEALEKLIDYIERNRPYIPCYGVRKKLGLRNSSNIGEKMNDLVVSDRQKHNGMSWSKDGSVALATIEVIKRNDEYHNWFKNGDLALKLAA